MPGRAPIEPESKLVQIIIQMFMADGTLMGTQKPSLKQCGNSMAAGQQIFAYLAIITNNFVNVAQTAKPVIAYPAIRVNDSTKFN